MEEHHEVEPSRLQDDFSEESKSNNRVLEFNHPIDMPDEEFKDESHLRYQADDIEIVEYFNVEEEEDKEYEDDFEFHTGRHLLIDSNKTDLQNAGEPGSFLLQS